MTSSPAVVAQPGLVPYAQALELMLGLVRARQERRDLPEVVLILEHPPVITLGRRGGEEWITAGRDELARQGVELHPTGRGGLATYHDPGQAIAYAILDLDRLGLTPPKLVAALEQAVMDSAAQYGIQAGRVEGKRGVWSGGRKLASVGVAVSRNVTSHGVALNHGPDLSGFSLITPCGLTGVEMTSLSQLAGRTVDPARVRERLRDALGAALGLDLEPVETSALAEMFGLPWPPQPA